MACSRETPSCRSSLVSLMRCLLLALNQESWLRKPALVVVWLLLSVGLPPKESVYTPLPPSGTVEYTRTRPAGIDRYGSDQVRDSLTPTDVSLSTPTPATDT